MKVESVKLRCDNCKAEVPLYDSDAPGYDAPVSYDRSEWLRVQRPYATQVALEPARCFCSTACLKEWAEREERKEGG